MEVLYGCIAKLVLLKWVVGRVGLGCVVVLGVLCCGMCVCVCCLDERRVRGTLKKKKYGEKENERKRAREREKEKEGTEQRQSWRERKRVKVTEWW